MAKGKKQRFRKPKFAEGQVVYLPSQRRYLRITVVVPQFDSIDVGRQTGWCYCVQDSAMYHKEAALLDLTKREIGPTRKLKGER